MVLALVLAAVTMVAAEAPTVIKTRDGKTHSGKVLSELAKGYLFHNAATGQNEVIPFDQVLAVEQAAPAPGPGVAPPPPPPPTTPGAPPPPDAPIVSQPYTPQVQTVRGQKMQRELLAFERDKPNYVSSIIFLSVGAGAIVIGAALFLVGVATSNYGLCQENGTLPCLLGGLGFGAGVVFGVVGFIKLLTSHSAIARMEYLREALKSPNPVDPDEDSLWLPLGRSRGAPAVTF